MTQRRRAFLWLVGSTGMALIALAASKSVFMQRTVPVQAWQVTPTTVTDTVVCAGSLRTAKGTAVVADMPCVVKTVEVSVGDTVCAGDTLFTVDRESTWSKADSMGLTVGNEMLTMDVLPKTITAPMDGTVSAIHAKKGDWLSATEPCATLSDSGDIEVAITVNESALPDVKVGQAVRVTGVAFAKQGYDGVLTELATSAHAAVGSGGARTVLDGVVTIEPTQMDASLLSGLSAKAVITVDAREQALVVPYEAVVNREGTKASVYCLNGAVAYRRAVIVASETAGGLEIESGLQKGEWVVANADGLEGDRVAVTVEAVACRS